MQARGSSSKRRTPPLGRVAATSESLMVAAAAAYGLNMPLSSEASSEASVSRLLKLLKGGGKAQRAAAKEPQQTPGQQSNTARASAATASPRARNAGDLLIDNRQKSCHVPRGSTQTRPNTSGRVLWTSLWPSRPSERPRGHWPETNTEPRQSRNSTRRRVPQASYTTVAAEKRGGLRGGALDVRLARTKIQLATG